MNMTFLIDALQTPLPPSLLILLRHIPILFKAPFCFPTQFGNTMWPQLIFVAQKSTLTLTPNQSGSIAAGHVLQFALDTALLLCVKQWCAHCHNFPRSIRILLRGGGCCDRSTGHTQIRLMWRVIDDGLIRGR